MQKVCTDEDMLKNQILKYDLQWFAKDGEGGEKTEPATAKKLKRPSDTFAPDCPAIPQSEAFKPHTMLTIVYFLGVQLPK